MAHGLLQILAQSAITSLPQGQNMILKGFRH